MNIHNTPTGGTDETKAHKLASLASDLLKYRLDIENALMYARNSHSFDDIVDLVVTGRVHFYPLDHSFVLMEVQNYPQHKVYHVFLAGGQMPEIIKTHTKLLENARSLDCKYVSICGRKGWERALSAEGWTHQYSVLMKETRL